MKRVSALWRAAAVLVLAAVLIGLAAAPGSATVRGHVVIGVGPVWWGGYPYPWWGPYPYWRHPYWPYAPYAYYPPPVIVTEPPVYIQRPAAPEPAAAGYWYYCESAKAYYPTVPECPEPWIRVPPRPQ